MEEARWGFNWESMTEKCIEALVRAQKEAQFLGAPVVGTEHVLIGLLSCQNLGAQILSEFDVDVALVRATLEKFRSRAHAVEMRRFSWRVKRAVELAYEEARRVDEPFVNTDHLYSGLLEQEDCTAMKILADLSCPLAQVRERLRGRHSSEGGPLFPAELLAQIPVAEGNVPELEQLELPNTPARLGPDRFMEVLEELSRALRAAHQAVEGILPTGPLEPLPVLEIPEVDDQWPVVDEEAYHISGLVRQILSGALLRRAVRVIFEPSSLALRIEYYQSSGHCDTVEVPAILRNVIPFKVMRMARLNPMVKGRELEGSLTFRYRGQRHRMRVRSEPILKGLRVEVSLS